jgi:hypothetical protein
MSRLSLPNPHETERASNNRDPQSSPSSYKVGDGGGFAPAFPHTPFHP